MEKKVNFKKILSEKANFAIHCETAAEAKSLFRRLQKEGFRWIDDDELDVMETYWVEYEYQTTYHLYFMNNGVNKRLTFSNTDSCSTPFKQICFCDCESCKLDTPSV